MDGWAGYAYYGSLTGSGPYKAYIRTDVGAPGVVAHELGHNLGFQHSRSETFDTNGNPVLNEYGDTSDAMGQDGKGWNTLKVEAFGTLAGLPGAKVTGTSGRFKLSPLLADPMVTGGPRYITLPRPDKSTTYYLSYRDEAAIPAKYKTGLNIHTGSPFGLSTHHKTLIDGGQYIDAVNGYTVTQVGKDVDGGLLFDIAVTCNSATPTINIRPTLVAGSSSGQSLQIYADITNNDPTLCTSTRFTLSNTGVSGLSSNFTSGSLSLAPKATGTITIPVTTGAASGSISLQLADSDGVDPVHGVVNRTVPVIVDTTAPSAPTGLVATVSGRRQTVYLQWVAATDSESNVASYRIYRNGTLLGTSVSAFFSDAAATDTVNYVVKAVNGAGLEGPSSNQVSVTIATKKGGGRR